MDTQHSYFMIAGTSPVDCWLIRLRKALPQSSELVSADWRDAQSARSSLEPSALIIDSTSVADIGPYVALWRTRLPECPILIVAASPTWYHARAAFEAGATDYMSKSSSLDEISRALQRALDKAGQPKKEQEEGVCLPHKVPSKAMLCVVFL
jgi:DNA-binding NtrC family response regulator